MGAMVASLTLLAAQNLLIYAQVECETGSHLTRSAHHQLHRGDRTALVMKKVDALINRGSLSRQG
jgi:hypothetical protein